MEISTATDYFSFFLEWVDVINSAILILALLNLIKINPQEGLQNQICAFFLIALVILFSVIKAVL